MVYGETPRRINERKSDDPNGESAFTYVPDVRAILQSENRYVYGLNNPVGYVDPGGNFVITTGTLLVLGGALFL